VSRHALLLVVALGSLRDPCGTDTSPVGVNAACTRTSDCDDGLSCVGGVCTPPDAGAPADGGASDSNDSSATDGNTADP
jgi:hypothetical protein